MGISIIIRIMKILRIIGINGEVAQSLQRDAVGTWKGRGGGGHSSIMMGAWYGCQSGTGERKRTRMKRMERMKRMTCESQAALGANRSNSSPRGLQEEQHRPA